MVYETLDRMVNYIRVYMLEYDVTTMVIKAML